MTRSADTVRDGAVAYRRRGHAAIEARWIAVAVVLGAAVLAPDGPAHAAKKQPDRTDGKTRAIATGNSKVAQRLRVWHAAGTAAGNTGDFYDNRDSGHSKLNLGLFPQLDRIEYTETQKKQRLHWGAQYRMLFKHVTIGNSSTASSVTKGGSNTRQCLISARVMGRLYTQYRRSHLYVYPEHRDYDPGHNGPRGYGDLFPANTPYVITSQGSSGSDGAFVRAVAYTLAAFRPEVKRSLIKAGLLMPTVQMIFRLYSVGGRKAQYLTGMAHPPVFGRGRINVLGMVEMAHDMTADTVPPMIQLAVVEEDKAVAGRDYFDAFMTEKLFDTPAAVARVARSTRHTRRMVISAKGSYDLNRRKLAYHWVVLQGDPGRIKIKPLNSDRSVVELQVAYHRRRPVRSGSKMESNRVDIGAFVHNGRYYSAPGFISIYFLDNELRAYDSQGRILAVSYGYGETRIGWHAYATKGGDIKDYRALVDLIAGNANKTSLAARLLRRQFRTAQIASFRRVAKELRATPNATAKILTRRREALNASVLVRIEDALNAVKNDVNFYFTNASSLTSLYNASKSQPGKQAYAKAVSELRELAAQLSGDTKRPARQPFSSNPPPPDKGGLTPHHRNRIEQLNIAILQNMVYPGLLEWRLRPNFVPMQVSAPKTWRDVYRYAPDGRLIGWTRYNGNKKEYFTAEGALITEKDSRGRALVAHTVRYAVDTRTKPWSLKHRPGGAILHYKYASDDDPVGRVDRTEKR